MRILLHSRVQQYGGQSVYLRRYAVCWCFNQSGPKRQPYGGDFHSAKQRLNPGNNSLREIPVKETVSPPSEQFYLTTELSNVVGTSHIFVTSFGRYPCDRRYAFSSGKFSAHRLRILTVRSPWSVTALSAAHFRSQQPGTLLYIAPSPTQLDCSANCFTVTDSFRSHCFVLTVSLFALVKTPGNHLINASFSNYPSHSFWKRVSFIWTPPS